MASFDQLSNKLLLKTDKHFHLYDLKTASKEIIPYREAGIYSLALTDFAKHIICSDEKDQIVIFNTDLETAISKFGTMGDTIVAIYTISDEYLLVVYRELMKIWNIPEHVEVCRAFTDVQLITDSIFDSRNKLLGLIEWDDKSGKSLVSVWKIDFEAK